MYRICLALVSALILSGAVAAQSMDHLSGVWETDGYGYLFDIRDDTVTIYEQTSISCLESGLGAGALVRNAVGPVKASFPVSLPGFIDADVEVHMGAMRTEMLFHRTDTSTFMTAHRLKGLPEKCTTPVDASSASTLAVFMQTFREHYPFFGDRTEEWSLVPAAAENETALFERMKGLLVPLQDSHTALAAPDLDALYFGAEEAPRSVPEDARAKGFGIVEANYLRNPIVTYCGGQLAYAYLAPGIGYLRVRSFADYSPENTPAANMAELEDALDDIFALEHGLAALVLDIRDNIGGSDALALALAGRLTEADYAAYAKQAVAGTEGRVKWTDARETMVAAAPKGPSFLGSIVLLTGSDTISAGETFTMALMDRMPDVTRVGEATRGAFADMLPRILPNGWLFALPNERYLDGRGMSFDRTGIPPHVEIPVFAPADLDAGRDPALEEGLRMLKEAW